MNNHEKPERTELIALNIIAVISLIGFIFEFILLISEFFNTCYFNLCKGLFGLPANEYSFLMFLGIFTMSALGLHWGKTQRDYTKSQKKINKNKIPIKPFKFFQKRN